MRLHGQTAYTVKKGITFVPPPTAVMTKEFPKLHIMGSSAGLLWQPTILFREMETDGRLYQGAGLTHLSRIVLTKDIRRNKVTMIQNLGSLCAGGGPFRVVLSPSTFCSSKHIPVSNSQDDY